LEKYWDKSTAAKQADKKIKNSARANAKMFICSSKFYAKNKTV